MEEHVKLLITSILYLLLSLAFFSRGSSLKKGRYTNVLLIVFIFGIISLVFLFLDITNNWIGLRYIGYGFAGSFIIVFLFFLVDNWCFSYLETSFQESFSGEILWSTLASRVIISALLICVGIILFLLFIRYYYSLF